MRYVQRIVLVLLLLMGSCQGSRPDLNKQSLEVTALYGTDISQLIYTIEGEKITLTWPSISPAGQFIRIHLPNSSQMYQPAWDSAGGFIQLVVPGDGFIDVGVAAMEGYSGLPVRLKIEPTDPARTLSNPPDGPANEVDYLVAYQLDADAPNPNNVRLEWTELNTGDYNFDGEVNIADITPIVLNYAKTYRKDSAGRREQTVYWVDGDRNGEVNLADITPIVSNYGATVDGYKVYHGLSGSTSINRSEVEARNSNSEPLPPLYSALVEGLATDSWAVAPVDKNQAIGALSQVQPIVIEEFNAVGSLVISGLELYQFSEGSSGSFDSGYSLMRVVWPIEDIDNAEIGDIIEGNNGLFVLNNVPLDTQLELEITYAPVINLLTGRAFSEDPVANQRLSLESPVTTRFPFLIPADSTSYNMQPRINLLKRNPDPIFGYFVDLTVDTSWDSSTLFYTARLDYKNFRVAAKPPFITDYTKRPLLRDTDRDSISDAKEQEIADRETYRLLGSMPANYTGRVVEYDEASGRLVIADPIDLDLGIPPPMETIEFNFTEYTWFADEVLPANFVPGDVLGHKVEINGYRLLGGNPGPPLKWWANTITRTDL